MKVLGQQTTLLSNLMTAGLGTLRCNTRKLRASRLIRDLGRLYFAVRSLRVGAPVLICPVPIATTKSAMVVSPVSARAVRHGRGPASAMDLIVFEASDSRINENLRVITPASYVLEMVDQAHGGLVMVRHTLVYLTP